MRVERLAWRVARLLFAAFFLYAPLYIILAHGGHHPPEAVAAAGRFTHALDETGFMDPALIVVLLAGGTAMLFDRSAPIGLILLAPPIAVIAMFHWFLTRQYVWGSIWPIWLSLLAWHYRAVFARLWRG